MRLIRFGTFRAERPGVLLEDGSRRDLSAHVADWNGSVLGGDSLERLTRLVRNEGLALPVVPDTLRWGAPIARPGKVICIGLNYSDHAAETGASIPAEPIVFLKASNTVVGPNDDLQIPRGSEKTDWEVELGVVIGREALPQQPGRCPQAHRGICAEPRCFRTSLPIGAWWAVDEGKELRQLQSARPVCADSR